MNGDSGATTELLSLLRPLILRYCRARIGTSGIRSVTAEDVAQEACVGVLRALPRYRNEGPGFLAFVYGICSNKVADAWRRTSREPLTFTADAAVLDRSDTSPTYDPEQLAIAAVSNTEIAALLNVLSHRDRDILIMRVVEGMSTNETAQAIGMTSGAIRVAQHRALARLRSALAAETSTRRPAEATRSDDADRTDTGKAGTR